VNPRVLQWLRANRLTPADIARKSGLDVPSVTIDGHKNLWTIHYAIWSTHQWRDWAETLGYVRGLTPWRDAMANGHTEAEHETWMEQRWGIFE
jgi:hypothetical protein